MKSLPLPGEPSVDVIARPQTWPFAPAWLGPYRRSVQGYFQVLAGTFGRLALQAVYFFVLANTLAIADMGVFASASAAGMMLGAFTGFGFASFAFRAAAGRGRLLGRYMAIFYACLVVMLPLAVAAALPVYFLLFDGSISLMAFIAVIVVETVVWRLVEVIQQVNNGLGRYTTGSLVITLATLARAAGAVIFAASGGGSIETWVVLYAASNLIAMAAMWALYRPRAKLVWRTRLFVKRLRDGLAFSLAYCAFTAQNQIDKLIVLSLADPHFAGIYAISSRIVEFTTIPFRSFYVLYTRKLFGEGHRNNPLKQYLKVEVLIAAASTVGFLALLGVMAMWPQLLGPNVALAAAFFGLLIAVPAFKNLLEFHGELFFVYQRMTPRAVIAVTLVALNAGSLALLLTSFADTANVALWLNATYAGLYVLSGAAVYWFISRERAR
jgi:O-antigen/teichoic acid export membrane protein